MFEKNFFPDPIKVALRPLSLASDWPHMGSWFIDEFARGHIPVERMPVNHLQETFAAMLQCDFAQPFIGLLNDHPGFLVEICDGKKQVTGLEEAAHQVAPGDHFIRLIVSPPVLNMQHLAHFALQMSLEYFFSHQLVHRIVWQLNERDKHYIHLANRIGFQEIRLADWPGLRVFLYRKEDFSLENRTSF